MTVRRRARSRYGHALRLGARVGGMVGRAVRFRNSISRTKTQTTKSRARESAPLTYDNDFKTDYRYRRMPRRRRRRWVRFVKKVNAVTLRQQQGLKKIIFRRLQSLNSANGSCAFTELMLYSGDGSSANHAADLGEIFRGHLGATEFDQANDMSVAINTNTQKKLHFESSQLEVTVKNTGTNKAILEVYYIRCRKQHAQTTADQYNCVSGVFELGFKKQEQVVDDEEANNIGLGPQNQFQIGTTPFQSPRFCSTFKILKRKKFTVAPGNSVSWILKDPRNRTIEANNVRSELFLPFTTHGYFMQSYGEPGLFGPDPPQPTAGLATNLLIYTTRKYQYYAPVSNVDQSAYMNAI